MIRVYSSFTKAYMPKARVLAKTLKELHPDWYICAVFSDSLPTDFNLEKEPFDEIWTLKDLELENLESWVFKHSVVELCTAVKGRALSRLLDMPDTEGVFYLDPDIVVYNKLDKLVSLFDNHSILLTPHMLHPEDSEELIHGNEIVSTLAHGVFNLGFIGVANSEEGKRFASWWDKRLMLFCYDDVPLGIFTDQRWCDLIPAFFENYKIIRDLGYNVATWNILHRPITKENGNYLAGGEPLYFYHFTGFDSNFNFEVLLKKFAKGYPAAFELWDDYRVLLNENGHTDQSLKSWEYDCFENKQKIPSHIRVIYRQSHELIHKYPNPFKEEFYNYCIENSHIEPANAQ